MKKIWIGLMMAALFSLVAFAGTTVFDALTLQDVLTFSGGGTIDNTADDTLTITETNIAFAGTVALASVEIGGGFGESGITLSAAGVYQGDGAMTIEDKLTFSDGGTIDNSDADTLQLTETNIDLVGACAADALTLSNVLTFSDGGTIDNTSETVLAITETNIDLIGITQADTLTLSDVLTFSDAATIDNTNETTLTITETTIDLVGASLADGLTLSDVLTFSDSGTIDNTNETTLTVTEDTIDLVGATLADALTLSNVLTFSDAATIDNSNETTLALTETTIDLVGATLADTLTLSDDLTLANSGTIADAAGTMTLTQTTVAIAGIADITGNLAQDGMTAVLDGETSVKLKSAALVGTEAPDIRFGAVGGAIYTKFAVADPTGNLTITHVGGNNDLVTWTAGGGFNFAGAIEVDALTAMGNMDITGDLTQDGDVVSLDGETSVDLLSLGYISVESADIRLGLNATEYMKLVTSAETANLAITHPLNTPAITWTAASFDFGGTMALDATTIDGVLTMEGGATLNNTASADILALAETNITLTGILGLTGATTVTGTLLVDTGVVTLDEGATLDNTSNADILTITEDTIAIAGILDVTGNLTVDGTVLSLDGSTSATLISPNVRFGATAATYMDVAVTNTTGAVAITHTGDNKKVTWTTTGGFDFVGAFETDALTLSGDITMASAGTIANAGDTITLTENDIAVVGNFDANGTTISLDGSTLVGLISAGNIRLGYDDSDYMNFAVATGTGDVTITHTGTNKAVAWTADAGFTFTGGITNIGTIAAGTWEGGVIAYEYGGLEADVNAYDGLVRITGGATSAVTITANMISLLGSADYATARTNLTLGNTSTVVHSNLDLGSSGVPGTLDIFPSTSSRGKLALAAADSAADHTTTITNASQAAARTYTIPDAGGAAYFVMSTTSANTAGQIDREDLSTDDLVAFGVPLTSILNHDGTSLTASAAAGKFGLISGGYGSGTLTLDGELASGTSKTSTCLFEFILPPGYQGDGDVTLVVTAFEKTAAADPSTTLTAEVYESDKEGGVSADLYNTFDHTDITHSSWQTCTAVITDDDLVAGDRLVVLIQIVCNDGSGGNNTVAQIGSVAIHCDVKGS